MPPLMDNFGYYTMRGGCKSIVNPTNSEKYGTAGLPDAFYRGMLSFSGYPLSKTSSSRYVISLNGIYRKIEIVCSLSGLILFTSDLHIVQIFIDTIYNGILC